MMLGIGVAFCLVGFLLVMYFTEVMPPTDEELKKVPLVLRRHPLNALGIALIVAGIACILLGAGSRRVHDRPPEQPLLLE